VGLGRWALLAGVLCLPARAAAQFAPVGVPRGFVRLELGGSLESADRRYLDGTLEELAGDLASPALGSDRIPGLTEADARLARITGDPAARLNLGSLAATAQGTRSAAEIGVAVGITSRLTVFARLPLARASVTTRLTLDSTSGNAGFNPADPVFGSAAGAIQTAGFFQDFGTALQSLQTRLQTGVYDGSASLKALAQKTLTSATLLRDDLFGLLADPATAAGFAPTGSSPLGAAVTAQLHALQVTLAGPLGIPGFSSAPALPTSRASQGDLTNYLTNPDGPIVGRLDSLPLSQRGDAEVGGAWTLVDRWKDDVHGTGFRAAVTALARLGTGFPPRPSYFLDLGTGTGHGALGGTLTTDVSFGRVAARLTAGYLHQLAGNQLVRLTPPDQPFAPFKQVVTVRVDPGNVVALGAHPMLRLAPSFGIQAGVDYWRRASEQVTYASAGDSIPGIPASVLAVDSRIGVTTFSAGITYSGPGTKPASTGLPIDASWSFEKVIAGSGGRVLKTQAVRASVRLYQRLF
jgi:hypothetical protein